MPNRLQDKVVIVTGGASGIGRAMAVKLADHGARVVIADIDGAGQAVADELPGNAFFRLTDVGEEHDVADLVAITVRDTGRLDAICNNAGIDGDMGPTADGSADNFDRVLRVNLKGVYLGVGHAIRAMQQLGTGGSIINTASAAGLVGIAGMSAYCAAKAGVIGLTRAAAIEYASQGIRVNAICPGVIETPLVRGLENAEQLIAAATAATPAGRLGQPEDVADLAVFLASDESAFITGAAITVDGAYTAQ